MPNLYPDYIFAMHDRGGEHLMVSKGRRGWVLITEALGADPNNGSGSNYTDLSGQDLGVIVRLNHGYSPSGTLPNSAYYEDFARRCGNFVAASPGCHIWIIGNEMNLSAERPGGPGGQIITPALYVNCFARCRNEIRRRSGHEQDQVVVGAVGPWNIETKYPGNQSGDWVQYLADILALLGQDVDGIAIHTYTHGQAPHLVFSDDKMNAPFQNRHYHFRAYRDFMAAIPAGLRDRPIYITETDQYGAWQDQNSGWLRNAYQEIDDWNRNPNNQPIQALVLYRWIIGNPNSPQEVGWAIENKPGVQADFRDAMNNQYRVVLPGTQPDYRVAWLEVGAPGRLNPGASFTFSVKMRNDGRRTWAHTGTQAVRLGYRWIAADSTVTEGQRADLPRAVAPGEMVTLPSVTVQAPTIPGYYTLELDLVEGASTWFAGQGSPAWRAEGVQIGARYRAAWLSVAPPAQGMVGETVTFPVTVRNDGAWAWPPAGDNPVNLTYKWLDSDRNVVVADGLRTSIGQQVEPLAEVTLNARLQFPAEAGRYILQMDMVHEFVAWFQWKGSPVHEAQVQVQTAVPEFAAEWLDYVGPPHLEAGREGTAYLVLKNVGARSWSRSGDEAVQLGYRWFDAQDQEVAVGSGDVRSMPRDLDPGDSATFDDLSFSAPHTPGTYRLVWDLVQSGEWLSASGVSVQEQSIQIVAPEYGVVWQVLAPWPEQLPPGEVQQLSLRLRNIGTRPWAVAGSSPVHLAYQWFSQDGGLSEPWDTFRILLPRDVPPGASVDLPDIKFETPPVLGDYILRWDLVEEGHAWFFRQGGAPLELPVEISDRVLPLPWTAQASHNIADVGLAFDGNPDTSWDSRDDQAPGMWFQLDLGQVLVLDRVKVSSPGRGFPSGYQVKLSEDGQNWKLVAEMPRNWMNINAACAPCRARYLRLEQTGQPDWPASWVISEITVSATGEWAGAEASHYTDEADQAWDARLRTYWNTRAVKQKPGMWFRLDMGKAYRIERVTLIHPTSQQPRGYLLQISTDGQNWLEVGRSDDNWGQADVQFQPASARYVRVETTNSSPYHPWGIAEFVVWRSSPTWLIGRQG